LVQELIFYCFIGLGIGGLYAMLGSGLVVAYQGAGVINFGHGAIGMYSVYEFTQLRRDGSLYLPWVNVLPGGHTPVHVAIGDGPMAFAPAAALTMVMAALLGMLVHLLVFRPLRHAPPLGKVVGSIGVLLYLQAVALLNFGAQPRQRERVLPKGSWENFLGLGRPFPKENLYAAAAAVVLAALLWSLYRKTRFGTLTRAAAENETGTVLLGHSPELISTLNVVASAVLAALAGFVAGSIGGLMTVTGYTAFIVPALGAALIGGLASFPGTLAGGLALGMISSVMTLFGTKPWFPTWLSSGQGLSQAVPLLAIAGALFFRGRSLPIRDAVSDRRLPPAPRPRRVRLWVVVGPAVVLLYSARLDGPWELALTTSMISAIFLLSYVVVAGYVGQLSLAQLTLGGVAAFVMVRVMSDGRAVADGAFPVHGLGLPMIVALPVGTAVAVVVGVIVGLPAVRIRGVQLAVVTIAAALALGELYFRNTTLTGLGGDAAGYTAAAAPTPELFGLKLGVVGKRGLSDATSFTVFVLMMLVLCALLVTHLRLSGTGRRFLAVRANERAAAAAGVDVTRTKLLAFAIASALAGVGGCLMAFQQRSVSPAPFDAFAGLALLAFAYLGGISSVNGALVGGTLAGSGVMAYFLQTRFDNMTNYWVLLGGVGMVVTAIAHPDGIAPFFQTRLQRLGGAVVGAVRPIRSGSRPNVPGPTERPAVGDVADLETVSPAG
jgi:branched-chain amino acid transport system permease protein